MEENKGYITAGTGTISFYTQPEYECVRHGNIGASSVFAVTVILPDNKNLTKRYCPQCFMAMLDEFCQEVTEVKKK